MPVTLTFFVPMCFKVTCDYFMLTFMYGIEIQFIPAYPYQIITTEIMWCAIYHCIKKIIFRCKLIILATNSANSGVILINFDSSTIKFPLG